MGKRKERPLLTYVLDSREQRGYEGLAAPDPKLFDDGGFYYDGLDAGDITCEVDCVRQPVIIERKQMGDFYGCCRHDRGCDHYHLGNDPKCGARCRFERELARLAAYQQVDIIIEAPMALLYKGFERSDMSGLAVVNSMPHWRTLFRNVHFWTVTNRVEGQKLARTIIHEFCKHHLALDPSDS